MKRITLTSIVLILLVGCVTSPNQSSTANLAKQDTPTLTEKDLKTAKQDDRGHRARPMTEQRLAWLLEEYSTNSDQKVTWAEYNDWRFARFNKTDANNNGTVDAEEYVYEYENRLDKRYEEGRKAHIKQTNRRFYALDKNKNKSIEWSEFEASGKRIFSRWDTNGDGTINSTDPERESNCVKLKNNEKKSNYSNKNSKSCGNKNKNNWFSRNPISFIRMPTTHSMKGLMGIYDANKDDAVTTEEFVNERRSVFYLTDKNKDGVLSPEEYLNEFEDRIDRTVETNRRGQIKQTYVRFGVLDDNEDKAMTFEEFQVSGKRIFTRWDKNGDGEISNADVGI